MKKPYDEIAKLFFEQMEKEELPEPAALINYFEEEDQQRIVGEIFHAGEDARGAPEDGAEGTDQTGLDQKAFREALLQVKISAYDVLSRTAPIGEVMTYKKEMEQLTRMKLEM